MEELINRQEVIDVVTREFFTAYTAAEREAEIRMLPSRNPKRIFNKLTAHVVNGQLYYDIEYEQDGEIYIGYSSFSLDVISDYIKQYFMPVDETKEKLNYVVEPAEDLK